jgi:DUF4097 and DUF4098 domain-containing protein YvlB
MITMTMGLMAAALLIQDTDTTLAAAGVDRLDLSGVSGEVVVRGWDRDEVRVRADHSRRTEIEIRRTGGTLRVEAEGRTGWTALADFEISLPSRMGVKVDGMYVAATIEGVDGRVEFSSIEGDLEVTGGSGRIDARAINGDVVIDGTAGEIHASSAAQDVRITNASGDVYVEAIAGRVVLENLRSERVEATSVGGEVRFTGALVDGGDYYFANHGGRILLEFDPGANAVVSTSTFTSAIRIDYEGAPERVERGRQEFTIGSGSARVEIESYAGPVTIRTRGQMELDH